MSTDRAEKATRWAPAGAAVAVVAVVAVVAALLGGGGDDDPSGPAPLRLSAAAGAAAESAASADVSSVSSVYAGSYRLEGALPADGPQRGAVHRPASGPAAEDVVRRLAAALDLSGEPKRDGQRWTLSSATRTLDVSDEPGRPWWFGEVLIDPLPVEPLPGTETGGSAAAPAFPESAGSPVSEDAALQATRPLLEALGLTDADVRTEVYGDRRAVTAAPRIAGLPTQGWESRFELGPDAAIHWASGMLGDVTAGEEYPLVGAQEAFDLLSAQPATDIAMLCAPDVPCGPVEQVVTGAEPGLQLHGDEQGPLLVPAWLFTVRDAPQPVAGVAVEPAYLAPPEVPDAPVAPPQVDPVPPVDPGAPAGRATLPFDRAARGAQEAEVVVGYGDSGSCPWQNVVPRVEETDEVVTVTLEVDAQPADQPCTADYLGVDVTVTLERALGDRTLVDGATGKQHELP